MKVIGAGFGRTGTKSLQLALEQLGFGKCYHMEELFRNPEGVKQWKQAYEGNSTDWDTLFKDYQSIVDFPGSIYFKELADFYPNAKVILTVRDPEKWYQSALKTIYSFDPGPGLKLKMLTKMVYSAKARNLFKSILLNNKSIWGRLFDGKFKNKEHALRIYEEHSEKVKQEIPEDRLLIFQVNEGWEPLCKFLRVDVPETPFPRTNKKEDFHVWAKGIVKDVLS